MCAISETRAEVKGPSKKIALIGASHVYCIKHAIEARGPLFGAETVITPPFEPIGSVLDQKLASLLDRAADGAAAICVVYKGNQQTVYGLLRRSPVFDVILGECPHLSIADDCEIIPELAFADFFRRSLHGLTVILPYLQKSTSAPLAVMGPPPPIKDRDFLAANLDPYFRQCLRDAGIQDAAGAIAHHLLRWKIWRILTREYESIAERFGALWLPAPEEALDDGKFLSRQAWGLEATHANAWFGELRLKQLEALL